MLGRVHYFNHHRVKERMEKENQLKDVTNTSGSTQKTHSLDGSLHLDKHFDLIHETHNELQQQLHRIETSTNQTNVDLEQLYSRSRSNNDNLNKLLKNVVEYSNEVITEGNATKADMSLIVKALDEMKMRNVSLGDDDFAKMKDTMRSIYREREGQDIELKTELKKLATFLKDGRISKKILQEQFEHLTELIKAVDTSASLEKIEEALKNQKWKEEIRRELNTHSEQMQTVNKQVLAKLSDLDQHLHNRGNDESSTWLIASRESKVSELETKIQTLETKYNSLVEKYSQKYEQYKLLSQQFEGLSDKAQTHYLSDPSSSNLHNLKRFHKSSLRMIDENNSTQSDKRIVSTPVGFANNSDED
ncbi:hypothetical protein CORT_0F04520 [Candida orthopsilosis Co 90-125]|uniref:Uncharacterized protein n=1 Tax=Candida orthopsilosis (strain 90-125) TaxID=1136231 RepID=H8X9L0_CANO9|nr:hypothetical protein CORT_0F04520 [Candida orthopsilosis Co 90-125]CCG24676.1 hypothetical protein CORT_0F04520 [Candida orthopsilosis Co 90-125]